ncbi:MAG: hypothetical protein ACOYK5_01150 [Bacteroidia bacterium]|jgi:hypothetical protein
MHSGIECGVYSSFRPLLPSFAAFVVDLCIEKQVDFCRLWIVDSIKWLEEQP